MIFTTLLKADTADDGDPRTSVTAGRSFNLPPFVDQAGRIPVQSVIVRVRVKVAAGTLAAGGGATLTLYLLDNASNTYIRVDSSTALLNDQLYSIGLPASLGRVSCYMQVTSVVGTSKDHVDVSVAPGGQMPMDVSIGDVSINVGASSGLATAANQATEIASLASIDGKVPAKGTAVMTGSAPVTIATDDTQITAIKNSVAAIPAKGTAVMTASTPVTLASDDTLASAIKTNTAPAAANAGYTLTGNGAAQQLANHAATRGVWVSIPLATGVVTYIGGSDVASASKGVELQPGDREFFPVANANLLYAFAASGPINYVVE